jgi:hypothetical protein
MNLTIELSDEKAAALKAQAEARGLTVERWVEQWVEQIAEQHVEAQPVSIAHLQKTDPKEWARRFHEWAESHDRTKPPLSDEAISRESIYPDRV